MSWNDSTLKRYFILFNFVMASFWFFKGFGLRCWLIGCYLFLRRWLVDRCLSCPVIQGLFGFLFSRSLGSSMLIGAVGFGRFSTNFLEYYRSPGLIDVLFGPL